MGSPRGQIVEAFRQFLELVSPRLCDILDVLERGGVLCPECNAFIWRSRLAHVGFSGPVRCRGAEFVSHAPTGSGPSRLDVP